MKKVSIEQIENVIHNTKVLYDVYWETVSIKNAGDAPSKIKISTESINDMAVNLYELIYGKDK